MTTLIDKEINSVCNIKIKGLGDPGPFSFVLVEGQLPTGVTFNQDTYTLEGIFEEEGSFSFRLKGYKKERIENEEDFTINVSNFNIVTFDFKSTLSTDGISWTNLNNSVPPVKVSNDDGLFDGECYYFKDSPVNYKLPFALLDSDFEIHMVFKPMDNLANEAWGSYISFVVNGLNVTLLESGNPLNLIVDFGYFSNWSRGYTGKENEYLVKDEWNEIFFIKRNSVFKFFINGKLVAYNFANTNITPNDLYIGGRYDNRYRTTARWKYLNISKARIEHWKKPPAIKNVIKARFLNENLLFVDDTAYTNIDLNISQNLDFKAIASVEVPLPQGLSIRDNSIVGRVVSFERPISSIIRLQIENVDHRSMTFTFLNKIKPNYYLTMSCENDINSTSIVSDEGRVFGKNNSLSKFVTDDGNLRGNTALNIKGYINTSISDIALSENYSFSFWVRLPEFKNNPERSPVFYIGSNTTNRLLIDDNLNVYISGNLVKRPRVKVQLTSDFKHIMVSVKGRLLRLFVDGILCLELDYIFEYDNGIGFGRHTNQPPGDEVLRIFDLKYSRYTCEKWEPYIPQNLVKRDIKYTGRLKVQLGLEINEKIYIDYPWDNYELVLKRDESSIPNGLTVNDDLTITGIVYQESELYLVVDLFIDGTLNNSANLSVSFLTFENLKANYLTHSVFVDSVDNKYKVQTLGTGLTIGNLSPIDLDGRLYIDFNNNFVGNDTTESFVKIKNNNIDLRNPFCIELDIFLRSTQGTGGVNIREPFDNVLFSKNTEAIGGNEYFYISKAGELCYKSGTYLADSKSFNTGLYVQTNKHHKLIFVFNGNSLKITLDSIQFFETPWSGWHHKATGDLQLGGVFFSSYRSYNLYFTGFINNFNIYQDDPIYIGSISVEDSNYPLVTSLPLVIPGKLYKERIRGSVGSTISVINGRLPSGLSIDNEFYITGVCDENPGTVDCEFLVTRQNGSSEIITVSFKIAKAILDFNPSMLVDDELIDRTGTILKTKKGLQPVIGYDTDGNDTYYFPFSDNGKVLYVESSQLPSLDNHDFVLETSIIINESFYSEKFIFGLINRFQSSHTFKLTINRGLTQTTNASNNNILGEVYDSTKNVLVFSFTEDGSTFYKIRAIGLDVFKVYKIKILRLGNTIEFYLNDLKVESMLIPDNLSIIRTGSELIFGSSFLDTKGFGFSGYISNFSLHTTVDANYVMTSEKGSVINGDIYYDAVNLYMDFNNNTVNLRNNISGSIVGNAFFDPDDKKTGTHSLDVHNKAGGIRLPYGVIHRSDFTVEAWIKVLEVKNIISNIFCQRQLGLNTSVTSERFEFRIGVTGCLECWDSASDTMLRTRKPIPLSEWVHVAVSRQSNTFFLFINGELLAEQTYANFPKFAFADVAIGYFNVNNLSERPGNFKIDSLRVTNGVARYSKKTIHNFNKPLDEAGNTNVLLGDQYKDAVTCLYYFSNGSLLNTKDNKAIKLSGQTKLTTDVSLNGTTSLGFYGDGDAKNDASSTYQFVKGVYYTLEGFFFITEEVSRKALFGFSASTGTPPRLGVFQTVNLSVRLGSTMHSGNISVTSEPNVLKMNSWNHVALTVKDEVWKVFVNGKKVIETDTKGTNYNVNGSPWLSIGSVLYSVPDLNRWTGYVDSLRLTDGISRYNNDFQPPSKFLENEIIVIENVDPHWENVVLYLDFDGYSVEDGFKDYSLLNHKVVNNNSTAVLSSDNSFFGNRSLYLDGTNDFLTINKHESFNFGLSDFTIELFINLKSLPSVCLLLDNWHPGIANSWQLLLSGRRVSFYRNGNYIFYGTTVLESNKWYHIAYVRKDLELKVFINGVLELTAHDDVNYTSADKLAIGAQVNSRNSSYDFYGYIDEIRITKGIARYTDSFPEITNKFPKETIESEVIEENSDTHWEKVYSYLPLTEDFKEHKTAVWTINGEPKITRKAALLNNSDHLKTKVVIKNIDFTLEFFINLNRSTETTSSCYFFEISAVNSTNEQIVLRYYYASRIFKVLASGTLYNLDAGEIIDLNKRYHIAITNDGTNTNIFVNGKKNSFTLVNFISNSHDIFLGRSRAAYNRDHVLIDNFRLTLDVVRYKSDFIPPEDLDTSNYISYKDVVLGYEPFLYIPMDDTTGQNPIDLASNATINLVNITATTYVNDQEPLAPGLGRSMGFNITSNGTARLEVPHEQFGTKLNNLTNSGRSFTIMGWHKRTSSTTFNIVMAGYNDPFRGYTGFRLYGNNFESRDNSNRLPVAIELNVPTFFCVIRDKDKGIYRSFVNGTWTDGLSYNDSQTTSFGYPLQIPGNADWNYYGSNGYYSDFAFFDKALGAEDVERIYNTALNPKKTKPLDPLHEYVVSHLKFDQDLRDEKNLISWQVVGTPTIEDGMVRVSGSNYIQTPIKLGENNEPFTIEFQTRKLTNSRNGYSSAILQWGTAKDATDGFSIEYWLGQSKGICYRTNYSSVIAISEPDVDDYSINHVSINFDGDIVICSVNGKIKVTQMLNSIGQERLLRIGAVNGSWMEQKDILIDNLRITKGAVRYTGEFVPVVPYI